MSFKKLNFNETEVVTILGGPIRVFFTEETVGTKELMFVMGDFEPGEGLDPHAHDDPLQDEVYYCISGNGTVWWGEDEKETPIGPGDALFIPKGVHHYVKNTGNERLIIAFFLAPGR
ncbi:MAG: cupin domain-containing protein [Promethearchaeota archaeon]